MRHVVLHAIVDGLEPDAVHRRISDFRRYPEFTDTVREVRVDAPLSDGTLVSEWTVVFRGGRRPGNTRVPPCRCTAPSAVRLHQDRRPRPRSRGTAS
ncbi:SRPBCC family protein [Streptomyces cadmiisoli]|uniref:SRPBCC family protein n=1 Tax=Streptomyces cadmiisoli TaxID=2184053 RepID=UPI003661BAF3